MDFEGYFETHFTVSLSDPNQLSALQSWSRSKGLKCLHIVLDRGVTPCQPMLTRWSSGSFDAELQSARGISLELAASGFSVSRVKMEVEATKESLVPEPLRKKGYFECHLKLLLNTEVDLTALEHVVMPHEAHLSRNALSTRSDGRQERFVTQRCNDRFEVAWQNYQMVLLALQTRDYQVLEEEFEFVVYDSNRALDAGWLPKE